MRAVVVKEVGDPDKVVIEELPPPEPGPGEVAIDMKAAAVNFPDVLLVGGDYQIDVPPPFDPGESHCA